MAAAASHAAQTPSSGAGVKVILRLSLYLSERSAHDTRHALGHGWGKWSTLLAVRAVLLLGRLLGNCT